MKLKKLFAGLISLAAALLAVCAITVCAGAETSGDYEYSVLDGGTVKINYYSGSATDLSIPATIGGKKVTSIGYYAFQDCTSLTSVIIPNSVTTIADSAFYGCSNLTSITIPDSVTSIGYFVFRYCSNLTSIDIPDSVTSIGNGAFAGCSSLTSITIPSSVTSIGNYAFRYCSNLTSIDIPDGVTSMGGDAFSDTPFLKNQIGTVKYAGKWAVDCDSDATTATIKSGTVGIADNAFAYCSKLTSIDIPKSVTSIGGSAFEDCSSLTSIIIPDGVTDIGLDAFRDCSSLISINIPESVVSIGRSPSSLPWTRTFDGCTSLTSINVDKNNKVYSSKDGVIFNKDMTEIMLCPRGLKGEYIIPDGVTSIGYCAFENCLGLTSIDIPDSVTSIEYHAFSNCSSLKSIHIPDSVTSIGSDFEGSAFSGCSSLISINIPSKVTTIYSGTFSGCSSLTSITIPDGVTVIDDTAFWSCSNLTSINIPDSVTRIGIKAFSGTPILDNQTTTVKYVGKWAVDCDKDATTATIKSGTVGIAAWAFDDCLSLISVTIPDSVTSIGQDAFSDTPFLKNQTGTVKYAGKWVIDCDRDATTVTIKSGTVGIADKVFYYFYSSLTTINIPDGVTSIGRYAFYNCSSLKSINIPDSVTSIDAGAFYGCSRLIDVYYTGSKAQWSKIDIVIGNEDLTGANIHYLDLGISGLKLKARAADALRLSWTKNPSADGYIIEMKDGSKWVRVGKITKNSTVEFRKAGLKAGTAYSFRIRAYKMNGKTALYSGYTSISARTNPSAVTGLKLKGRSGNALRISWTKNTSADGYIIEMKNGSKWERVAKITKNSTVEFRKDKLKAGTAYTFRVKAYKMSGKTALYGATKTISVRTNPSAMSGLKLKASAKDAVRLSWTKNTSADGYIIEMKSGNSWVRVGKVTKNSTVEFRKGSLKSKTSYSFRIKAYKMSGKTALYGATKTITVKTK